MWWQDVREMKSQSFSGLVSLGRDLHRCFLITLAFSSPIPLPRYMRERLEGPGVEEMPFIPRLGGTVL